MSVQRRLAAILSADVVGYSRLMGVDEAGTLARLQALRAEAVDPAIAEHNGRMVKLMGDGALVEFGSVVDAVECAVEIQHAVAEAAGEMAEGQRIEFRIGVNLGDVIIDGDDIYGDGVNIAARLQEIAEPGGVCISGSVFEQIKGKLDAAFDDMGAQDVKNIADPVRAYRWAHAVAGPAREAPLALPDKPSLAVLAFDNLSGDTEQEYFSDGIAEDIITELSKYRSLFVIARTSSFEYKGRAANVRTIGRELGVQYIVEGSVRRAGNRVRITAQLVEAATGNHLWAQRYDRDLEDIFAVQDEVTEAIVTAIEPELATAERRRVQRKPVESLDAWESYQRGLWHVFRYEPGDSAKAQQFFHRAIELDPNLSSAHAGLAYALYYDVILGLSDDPDPQIARAIRIAKAGVSIDPTDPFAHVALGRNYLLAREYEASLAALDVAIALTPNYANAHFGRAHTLWHSGRPKEAIVSHDEAIRLSPRDPLMWAFLASKAIALLLLERYDEAAEYARQALRQPNTAICANMAEISALGHLGRTEEAGEALARARAIKPDLTIDFVDTALKFKRERDRQHYVDGLIKAGVPERACSAGSPRFCRPMSSAIRG